MSRAMENLRRVSPLLLLLTAFLALATVVSVMDPLFEPTDEIRHYRYIRHLVVEHRLPVQGEETVRSQSHHPPLYYALSGLFSAWVPCSHTPAFQQPTNPFWGYRSWEVGVDNKLQYLHSEAERFPFREGYLAAMVGRWVNILLGALTIYLTYRLGRRVWQERPALAWAAAALVAFTPQFVYLSAAMNNDIAAAGAGTGVLLLSVVVAQQGLSRKRLIALGTAYGLALLTKFHLVVMGGVIALALASATWRTGRRSVQRWVGGMAVVLALAALLAGWWFARNWLLYGDPSGLNKVNELWGGRAAGSNWWALWQGLPYLWTSLWGRFGYGQIPLPRTIYDGLLAFCALSLLGYLLPRRSRLDGRALPLLAVTVLGFVAVVSYYILIQPAGPMGRFLFPAFPAFAVLLVGGLERWTRRPVWTAVAVAAAMGGLALVALFGFLRPAVSYPQRPTSPLPGQPRDARLGDVARMLSAGVSPATAHPGEQLFVTVTWEPLRQSESPYIVYVHLVDEAGVLVAQRDTWPGLGRAPTTAWRPGVPFVDIYQVDLPATTYAPDHITVRVGLYEPGAGRLPVVDSTGEVVGDGVEVGTVEVAAQLGPWPNNLHADFGAEIALVGYEIAPRSIVAGETFTLTLYWEVLRQPERDYQVFAQLIDPAYQVWGSKDGAGPGWAPGEVVQDVRRITTLPETPPGSYPVQVGLFYEGSGRLPVVAPDGRPLDERVLLGPVRVRGE